MSDTPETDAEAMDGINGYGDPLKSWDYKASKDGEVVPAEFARRLERERNEAWEELARVRKELVAANLGAERNAKVNQGLCSKLAEAERERDEARRERDEARRLASVWEELALREAGINGARLCAKGETSL